MATEQALDSNLAAVAYSSQSYANAINLITIDFDAGPTRHGPRSFSRPRPQSWPMRLMRANQALAKLTTEQANSKTLAQLRSFNARVEAATTTVEAEMKLIRQDSCGTNHRGSRALIRVISGGLSRLGPRRVNRRGPLLVTYL